MPPVIFAPYIGIATINVMHKSMHGVLLTRAISLRSRMRGKLSCPVLKAGRRERSLLPSYQAGTVSMATSTTNLHLEKERETEAARYADLERQTSGGSDENDLGCLFR